MIIISKKSEGRLGCSGNIISLSSISSSSLLLSVILSSFNNEKSRCIVDITTLLSVGTLEDFKRLTVKIVLNGSPFSIKRNVPNSVSACLPKLFLSTKNKMHFIDVKPDSEIAPRRIPSAARMPRRGDACARRPYRACASGGGRRPRRARRMPRARRARESRGLSAVKIYFLERSDPYESGVKKLFRLAFALPSLALKYKKLCENLDIIPPAQPPPGSGLPGGAEFQAVGDAPHVVPGFSVYLSRHGRRAAKPREIP